MERAREHAPERARDDGEDTPSASRSRVAQALVCPYCRDAVGRRGTVACARPGCGALYHRECFAECVSGHGACAIFGCASTSAREVSLAGFVLRFVRLLIAALLLPPRVLASVRRLERDGAREVFRDAMDGVRNLHPILYLVVYVLGLVSVVQLILVTQPAAGRLHFDSPGPAVAAFGIGTLCVIAAGIFVGLLPFLVALVVLLGVGLARLVAAATRSEAAALTRADGDGGGVVAWLRRARVGKKDEA